MCEQNFKWPYLFINSLSSQQGDIKYLLNTEGGKCNVCVIFCIWNHIKFGNHENNPLFWRHPEFSTSKMSYSIQNTTNCSRAMRITRKSFCAFYLKRMRKMFCCAIKSDSNVTETHIIVQTKIIPPIIAHNVYMFHTKHIL